ncbi:hypothetical protein BO86DRAFT_436283 [Aspergillus japonicus CBS 114.51]|uniref:Uncharacterized protein n=2 Tax=Aspergillus TaxID=5052 RepID=A0A2V5GV97_ASPV1|nr:hypothetical protein BO86DRAFT_436283 [Aspergillus japonicus CBS 114.51]PYI14941.1 hypothetical protein BO99DRAFT_416399 [Aspergillus violaceofuscus CBS 115571]RAH79175.1 hypothetical protein BO86DRAFT_436283 [Aspergillus japonicus CBS 114.51]
MPNPPALEYAFTLHVDLAPALDYGSSAVGHRRFIPITGGTVTGPKLQGTIVPHSGGDWNAVRADEVVHVYARYSIRLADGTLVGITNEGYGRASAATMKSVFEDEDPTAASMTNGGREWYTRTLPKFEVGEDRAEYRWLTATVFLGVLKPPTRQGYVEIDVFEVL